MNPIVLQFAGWSIGIGLTVSALTEIIKLRSHFPIINRIPFIRVPVQWVVDFIVKGEKRQVQFAVAIMALGLNYFSVWYNTGVFLAPQAAYQAFISFFTALGTYNLVFQDIEKKDREAEEEASG